MVLGARSWIGAARDAGVASAALKIRLISTCWISLLSANASLRSGGQLRIEGDAAGSAVVGHQAQRLAYLIVEIETAALRRRGPGEIDQILERGRDARDLREDGVQRRAPREVGLLRQQRLHQRGNRTQRIVDLVRHAGGEGAGRGRGARCASNSSSISRRWVTSCRIICTNVHLAERDQRRVDVEVTPEPPANRGSGRSRRARPSPRGSGCAGYPRADQARSTGGPPAACPHGP